MLATIARLAEELGGECYLVTGDKDCRQLITDRVKVYNIRKDQVYRPRGAQGGMGDRARSRSSIFRPWWAIRSTTCPACR